MSVLSKIAAYDITVNAGVIYVNLPETGPDDHDPLTDKELDRIRSLIGEKGDVGAVVVRGDDDWKVCQVTEEIKLHFMESGLSPCVTQYCFAYMYNWTGLVKEDQSEYGYTIFVTSQSSVSTEKKDEIKYIVFHANVLDDFVLPGYYSIEMATEDFGEFVEELSVEEVDKHMCNVMSDY